MAMAARPSADDPILTARGLAIGWDDVVLQRELDFEVHRGEIFAILGGSGSGKSTLLRFLVGLEEPLAGTIDVAGRGHVRLDGELPPFGVMFQAGALFGSMTVVENVALPLEEHTDLPADAIAAIARSKLRLVGLEAAADKLPNELSGGMKKRAAIARALALDPDLVFLDEPSAGLDPITSAELDQLILTLNATLGLTVVLVSHELESINAIAHRAIVLDKEAATIIAAGPPRELKGSDDARVSDFFNRRPSEASMRSVTSSNARGT
jgi:phospholipid/cholesterol/gamma-HCH transport system ATP-binding protein